MIDRKCDTCGEYAYTDYGMCPTCLNAERRRKTDGECAICGENASRCEDCVPYCLCGTQLHECECGNQSVVRCDGCDHIPSHCQCHIGSTDVSVSPTQPALAIDQPVAMAV